MKEKNLSLWVEKFGLYFAMALCFLLRSLNWIVYKGLYYKDGGPDVDAYLAMSSALVNGTFSNFKEYRVTQLLYPILLSPIPVFSLSVPAYVFFLHQLLALIMVYFGWQIGKKIWNETYGFCVAMLLALNWRMAFWSSWMLTETLYYCLLIVTVYVSIQVWTRPVFRNLFFFLLSSILLFLVKPESIAYLGVALLVLAFVGVRQALSFKKALTVVSGSVAIGIASFFLLFSFHQTFRYKLLTHFHVSQGLWFGITTSTNPNGVETGFAYAELERRAREANAKDQRLFGSETAIQFIKEKPFTYLGMAVLRGSSILIPSLYCSFRSPFHRTLDFLYSVFFLLGVFFIFLFSENWKKVEVLGVILCAASMTVFVSFYLADGDFRIRLPIHCVLSVIAPYGWLLAAEKVRAFGKEFLTAQLSQVH